MTRNIQRLSRASLLLAGGALAAWTSPVWAQTAPATAQVEEVVVTGSLFKESVAGSQLVTTITSEQEARLGATNAVEALKTLGQNQPTITSTGSSGTGTGFASYANLRGLGSENTLVLFDSKRVVNNPYQSLGVDLNTLPLNVVDRIETLSDGASSIYGSDAIAGVINFIPKQQLQGFSIAGTTSQPEHSGGEKNELSASGGLGSLSEDGWNLYAGYTWRRQDELKLTDRSFSDEAYIPARGVNRLQNTTFPANWSQGALSLINPSRPGCAPPLSIYIGAAACWFDFASQNLALPQQEDRSLLVHGITRFAGQTFTLEYMRGADDLLSTQATAQVNSAQMFPNSPYFPGNGITPGEPGLNPTQPVTVNWRVLEAGPIVNQVATRTSRILGELDGNVLGFDYQAWALYSESSLNYRVKGTVDVQALRNGVGGLAGAPFLNPFGPQSAAGEAYLASHILSGEVQNADSTLKMVGVQADRTLFELPAGPVKLAVAADYKEDTSEFHTDPVAALSQLFTVADLHGARKSASITSEVKAPLLDGLNLDASLRYDHYSDFGGTVTPKVLLSWRARDWLTVQASYNKGFRAPTLYNLFSPITTTTTLNRRPDPVLCPGGVVNSAAGGVAIRDCGGQPYQILIGGNPDLSPEKSDAYTVGFRLRPTDSLKINLDYWNYVLTDTIAPLPEIAIFSDLAKFGNLVVRCSTADPKLAALVSNCAPGHVGDPIAYVEQRPQNLGDSKTDGIDANISWQGLEHSWGRLRFDYSGTYVLNFRYQEVPQGPFLSRDGAYSDGSALMRYTHFAALTWTQGRWDMQLSNRYQSSYTDCNAQCLISPQFFDTVKAYSLWNISASTHLGHVMVIGRVTNLLDTNPPFTNKILGVSTGWDERYSDPIGRAFSMTLKYDF
ncbi:TonB-dependent receptor plug domain-containing protein [Phenylobacterium sp.]|jgi:iron complex outermembrane receptor protein|uniref:TonB-dependent receptor plug domain-containing protein n=1 Tax=Phenylobacterium sp. TaxID=1871053 RepID=UPI002E2F7826|nr:TonB-dependent receptor [Phenylobacterium sp.]HEX3366076.1 TonB-dependent receptor [Phenylobacterium sp.]